MMEGDAEMGYEIKPVEHDGSVRWVFSNRLSDEGLLRSISEADVPLQQQAWESWLPDAAVWVPSQRILIEPLPKKLTLSSEKSRVNGGYTLYGAQNKMPLYVSGKHCLYWSDCWIVAESQTHMQKGKGVLRTAPSNGLPFGAEEMAWMASNTAQRRWLPTVVKIDAVERSASVLRGDNPAYSPIRQESFNDTYNATLPVGAHRGGNIPLDERGDRESIIWQENTKKSEEILLLERSLQSMAKKRSAKVLRVDPAHDAPTHLSHLTQKVEGLYYQTTQTENGYPIWERRSKFGRLYSSTKGCWVLTLHREYSGRETGVLGTSQHYGRLPDDEELLWGPVAADAKLSPMDIQLLYIAGADELKDFPGENPPPTPSQMSSIPTELDCDDALLALEQFSSQPGDNSVLFRLYVFLLRLKELCEMITKQGGTAMPCVCVSEFLPKRFPTTRELLRAVREERVDVTALFTDLCTEWNKRLRSEFAGGALRPDDWIGTQCRACVEHILRHLHMRGADVTALETLPLAVEGVLTGRVCLADYTAQLCAKYGPTCVPVEWSGDFPTALVPEDFNEIFFGTQTATSDLANPAVEEAIRMYMERELGMSRGEINAKMHSGAPQPRASPKPAVVDLDKGDSRPSRSSTDTAEDGASKRRILSHVRELRLHHENVAKQQESQLSMLKQQLHPAQQQQQQQRGVDYMPMSQKLQNDDLRKQIQDLRVQQEQFQRATLDALQGRTPPQQHAHLPVHHPHPHPTPPRHDVVDMSRLATPTPPHEAVPLHDHHAGDDWLHDPLHPLHHAHDIPPEAKAFMGNVVPDMYAAGVPGVPAGGGVPGRSGSMYSIRTEGSGMPVNSPVATLPPGSPPQGGVGVGVLGGGGLDQYAFLSPPHLLAGGVGPNKMTSPPPPLTGTNRALSPPPGF